MALFEPVPASVDILTEPFAESVTDPLPIAELFELHTISVSRTTVLDFFLNGPEVVNMNKSFSKTEENQNLIDPFPPGTVAVLHVVGENASISESSLERQYAGDLITPIHIANVYN